MKRDKTYTPTEVAEILGVKRATVIYNIKKKNIKAYKIFSRYKINESDLNDFIKKSEVS